MAGLTEKTQRLQPNARLLGRLNFALLLCSLWLGATAGSLALLMLVTSADAPAPTAGQQVNAPAATRIIAESPYRTWDDVATAPLPGVGVAAKKSSKARLPAGSGMVLRPPRRNADKEASRRKQQPQELRRKRNQIKRDRRAVVDL